MSHRMIRYGESPESSCCYRLVGDRLVRCVDEDGRVQGSMAPRARDSDGMAGELMS